MTGFFGADAAGDVRLFGRGGSDTSATAIGAAIGAARVEIWTDVDGVATADPRRDPAAELLPRLSYDEAFRLARGGAKVLHWKAVAPARAAEVPIVVRNTFRPEAAGTWIGPEAAAPRPALSVRRSDRRAREMEVNPLCYADWSPMRAQVRPFTAIVAAALLGVCRPPPPISRAASSCSKRASPRPTRRSPSTPRSWSSPPPGRCRRRSR